MKLVPAAALVAGGIGLAASSSLLLMEPRLWPLIALGWILLFSASGWDLRRIYARADAVRAGVRLPPTCRRGEVIDLELELDNDSDLTLLVSARPLLPEQGEPRVWDPTVLLPPGARVLLSLAVRARVRGGYEFGDIYLRIRSRLRLVQVQTCIGHQATTRVFPDTESVKDYLLSRRAHSLTAPHLRTARLRGIGSEFESLREWEQGDDIRRIDWRATARHDRLIARNYEIEPYRNVLVVLDRGRLMSAEVGEVTKLDLALDAALMIAGVALEGGDRCGILVFDREVATYLNPRPSLAQLTRIVENVYDVQPVLEESHFQRAFVFLQQRLTKRSLVVVLSDMVGVDVSGSMLSSLVTLGKRHLVVLAALRSPEIRQVISAPVADEIDPFRKAVAYRLVKERTEALGRLRRGGVHVLDVAPDQLTLPLVNKYIELRERNLL